MSTTQYPDGGSPRRSPQGAQNTRTTQYQQRPQTPPGAQAAQQRYPQRTQYPQNGQYRQPGQTAHPQGTQASRPRPAGYPQGGVPQGSMPQGGAPQGAAEAVQAKKPFSAAAAGFWIVLLAVVVFTVLFSVKFFSGKDEAEPGTDTASNPGSSANAVITTSPPEETVRIDAIDPHFDPDNTNGGEPNPSAPGTGVNPPVSTAPPATTEPPAPQKVYGRLPQSEAVTDEWFADALFIGDSRTVGLWLYSGLKSTYYAQQSLNVSTVQTKKFINNNTQTLAEALDENKDFRVVYISFGINEFTYMSTSGFVKSFRSLIATVKEKLPDAVICVQAILPLADATAKQTKAYADAGGNKKIADLNAGLLKMCEEDELYYADLCEIFADANGALVGESQDGVHFGTADCKKWVEYLKTHTPPEN